MKKLFTLLIGLIFASALAMPVSADWNYITLSNYYAFPGQGITVHGDGFSNGEVVDVSLAGIHKSATVSGTQFTSPIFIIPISVIGQTIQVVASGNMGHTSDANLVVGTYYPNVTPSSWYLFPGNAISFSGKDFGPNEQVKITGADSGMATTDSSGSFISNSFTVPNLAGNVIYNFIGQTTGIVRSVTIKIGNAVTESNITMPQASSSITQALLSVASNSVKTADMLRPPQTVIDLLQNAINSSLQTSSSAIPAVQNVSI